jgi:hypothetical protein
MRWYGTWKRGSPRKDTTQCGLDNRCQLSQQPFKSIVATSQEIPGSNFGTERDYPNNIAVSFLELKNHTTNHKTINHTLIPLSVEGTKSK